MAKPTKSFRMPSFNADKLEPTKAETRLNAVDDKLSSFTDKYAQASAIVAQGQEVYKTLNLDITVVDNILDGAKQLMVVLDGVAEIHPAVGVAVMAFKAVITLEINRRENDKKIAALLASMMAMMAVLGELNDGAEIKDFKLLEQSMIAIADQITDCGNFMELYHGKRLLSKIFKAPIYQTKLEEYATAFDDHKKELQLQMNVAVTIGVGSANTKLDAVQVNLSELLDLMRKRSEKEQEADEFVRKSGGMDAMLQDDSKLEKLAGMFQEKVDESLKDLIASDFSTANLEALMKENEADYNEKLNDQTKEIKAAMDMTTERILLTINAGPHDRVLDPDIKCLWKDMNWRGSVKANHFAIAVYDYYEHVMFQFRMKNGEEHPDQWTLEYMQVWYTPLIAEAIDENGTGWINISEINKFTQDRPAGWSLPVWLAYSTAGFKADIVEYATRINDLIPKIKASEDDLLDENKTDMQAFRRAFTRALNRLTNSQHVVIYEAGDTKLAEVIKLRRSFYEEEMKTRLGRLGYAVKGSFDLTLVAGESRIESYVLPLLYLLLERHYENMERGKTEHVAGAETEALTKSMVRVFAGVTQRVVTLEEMFSQRRLNSYGAFEDIAHGLLLQWHNFWSDRKNAQTEPIYPPDDDDDASLTGSAPLMIMGTITMEPIDEGINDANISAQPDYDIAGDKADDEDANAFDDEKGAKYDNDEDRQGDGEQNEGGDDISTLKESLRILEESVKSMQKTLSEMQKARRKASKAVK